MNTNMPENTLIITPNKRLAAVIRAQLNEHKKQSGCQSWQINTVLPFDAWLTQTFAKHQAKYAKTLISDFQSEQIWHRIIANSKAGERLLNHTQSAKLAQSAWQLLHQWQLCIDHAAFTESHETDVFKDWAKTYFHVCKKQQLIDKSQLAALIETELLKSAQSIAFLGFAEMTPEQTHLIDKCKLSGKTVFIDHLGNIENSSIHRTTCLDRISEINAMAVFCKTQLAQNPTATVGCVLPYLTEARHDVERIFTETLGAMHFNISAGQALSHYPVIHTALQLLRFKTPLSFEFMSHALMTPFISDAQTECLMRANLENTLRKFNKTNCSKNTWMTLLKEHCPKLHLAFEAISPMPQTALPSAYAALFSTHLKTLGWPGERVLNSLEYQTVQSFHGVLDQFASLDYVLNQISLKTAIKTLQNLCDHTIFQAQSAAANIQILGLLEAGGLSFDALWIAGLDDNTWPKAPAPNPFLPIRLQKKLDMPHASAMREHHFCLALQTQLLHSANTIMLSYAQSVDHQALAPSKLITHFPEIAFALSEKTQAKPLKIEMFEDNIAPNYQDGKITGGSSLFKSQANCPFQAFALYRLKAESLAEPYTGLNAADRGIIVHRALELIWQTLKTSDRLHQLSTSEQTQIIETAIATALKPYHLTPNYQALESERLQTILTAWLNLEKSGPSFKIQALEQNDSMTLLDSEFDIRADRIDELADGTHRIIDYKTKKTSQNHWQGARPKEPQLPLYALHDNQASSIAFGQVRSDGVALKTSDAENWQTQKTLWQTDLEQLLRDFKSGHAAVSPRDNNSCQTCDLQGLCRVHEVLYDS